MQKTFKVDSLEKPGEKDDKQEAREIRAWLLAMEEDFMKKSHPDVITQQHMTNVDKSYSETKLSSPCVACASACGHRFLLLLNQAHSVS
ncbi:hypothetical protein Q7C36_017408 [Tachysurus vachellii]|uniref:Uncharacterized protein n=1 Tax=Tachysurus vachellii TaxID=175792 RepID=A0AA88S7K4_TACVA|nr:hypothetical protein Q7C36_017408 [Tachysurus vachellii]